MASVEELSFPEVAHGHGVEKEVRYFGVQFGKLLIKDGLITEHVEGLQPCGWKSNLTIQPLANLLVIENDLH